MAGEPKEKRKPNAYILALKEFNKGKMMWCIPKKGSEDHKEVTRMKEKIMKGEKIENVIVHDKVKEIEKKEEKPAHLIESENKFEEYSNFDKMEKVHWNKLTPVQKRYIISRIIVHLPQIASMLKKKNPIPDMKYLPKFMHKEYKKYEEEQDRIFNR